MLKVSFNCVSEGMKKKINKVLIYLTNKQPIEFKLELNQIY